MEAGHGGPHLLPGWAERSRGTWHWRAYHGGLRKSGLVIDGIYRLGHSITGPTVS